MPKDHVDFQDNSAPLAYLITIRCYGTWLHGDVRGSMNRLGRNGYGAKKIEPIRGLENSDRSQMRATRFRLDARKRDAVERAVREVSKRRGYNLLAVHARTEHVHILVSSSSKPEPIMTAFKAYSTRRLRIDGLIGREDKVWSRHGSTKYIWTEPSVRNAIEYVLHEQGDELPNFGR
jgi:REP element-mobilizing transposase RayT